MTTDSLFAFMVFLLLFPISDAHIPYHNALDTNAEYALGIAH